MLEYGLRFLAGGIAVSVFTALGDTLRPKSFAGLFGAAASIALATLLITLSQKGAPFVAMESRSMIVGLRAGPPAAGQIIRDPAAGEADGIIVIDESREGVRRQARITAADEACFRRSRIAERRSRPVSTIRCN